MVGMPVIPGGMPMSREQSAAFRRYIGIDYSGAETPSSSLPGLRVYVASQESATTEVPPPPGSKKYWTRRGIAEWLVQRLGESEPTLVGIDHGFSFPLKYFERHALPTSMTPGPSPNGCAEQTSTAVLLSSSRQTSRKRNGLRQRSRVGSWGLR
jgi:hypothetical protein